MRPSVENLALLILAFLAEAWFLHGYFAGAPEFEPAIAFIGAIAAIFTKDAVKARFGLNDTATDHDRELFKRFQRVLPADPVIRFIKEHDFGDAFLKARIEPLIEFYTTWDTVETEFLDSKIQAKKKLLHSAAEKLSNEIVKGTVPVQPTGHISVFPDSLRATGQARPDHVRDDAKTLNELSREFVPQYEEFIRLCRKKLEK